MLERDLLKVHQPVHDSLRQFSQKIIIQHQNHDGTIREGS